jgi:tRNA nucleotidyltransferase (CCA-adding enzyme)
MRRLGLAGDLVRGTVALVRYHDHVVRPTGRSMRRTLAMLEEACPGKAHVLAHELMLLKRADAVSKQPKCAWHAVELDEMDRELRAQRGSDMTLHVRDLAIGGREVLEALGTPPGPMVGMTLSTLLQAVIDEEVPNTREDLLRELARLVQERE